MIRFTQLKAIINGKLKTEVYRLTDVLSKPVSLIGDEGPIRIPGELSMKNLLQRQYRASDFQNPSVKTHLRQNQRAAAGTELGMELQRQYNG